MARCPQLVNRPNGPFVDVDRKGLYAPNMLTPLENRDPGDETAEDDS
jgi:hypothetical protein